MLKEIASASRRPRQQKLFEKLKLNQRTRRLRQLGLGAVSRLCRLLLIKNHKQTREKRFTRT